MIPTPLVRISSSERIIIHSFFAPHDFKHMDIRRGEVNRAESLPVHGERGLLALRHAGRITHPGCEPI